ncbi:MAG: hypothetical protein H7Z17_15020, partial [Fuerstia sp.]|nr:hypothetical protein [Fuerstiella sp.]
QIADAFQLILNRNPTADEIAAAKRFVTDTGDDALTHLCLSLLNCNEFVCVD